MTKAEPQYHAWRRTPEAELVMAHFRRLAQEAANQQRPFGMKALAERIRWGIALAGTPVTVGPWLNSSSMAGIDREWMVQAVLILAPLVTA